MSNNIPKIRNKKFNEKWTISQLGDVGRVSMCKRIFKNQTNSSGKIPFFKIGTFGGETDSYISFELFNNYKNKFSYPKKGNILLSASGTIGRVVEYNGEDAYFQDSNIVWLEHNSDKIEDKFLKFFYRIAKWDGIEGSTINRLYNSNICNTFICYHSNKEEQLFVGNFLQNLDNLIDNENKKLQKLKDLKSAMLTKMFPKKGRKVPEIRFKNFNRDWQCVPLSKIVNYYNGKSHEHEQSNFGDFELINLNSISIDGGLKPSGKFVSIDKNTLQKNDLVMVLSDVGHGDLLGRVALIPENNKYVLNQRVALLRIKDDTISKYLYYYINANQQYFKKNGAGSSQLNISKNIVEDLEVKLPCIKEQIVISNFLSGIDLIVEKQQQKLEKLTNLKQAFLSKMFV